MPKEWLEDLINNAPMMRIGEVWGVSPNAIMKQLPKKGLKSRGLGYWTTLAAQQSKAA
jgi:hypothetical protein